jgi:hypothetical protein
VTQKEARDAYIKLLKDTEELTAEQLHLARESFDEGWLQCELAAKKQNDK